MPRRLAVTTAVLFVLSWIFPTVAAFVTDPLAWPKWWGATDVALAFLLAILLVVLQSLVRDRIDEQTERTTYRAYRVLTHGILLMLVVFFVAGDRIIWNQCLTGFAWRIWLLLYGLPAWIALMANPKVTDSRRLRVR